MILPAYWYLAKKGHIADVMQNIPRDREVWEVLFKDLIGTRYDAKCPNIRLNDKIFVEHEGFVSANSLNAFSNMISRGKDQAKHLIIDKVDVTVGFMI